MSVLLSDDAVCSRAARHATRSVRCHIVPSRRGRGIGPGGPRGQGLATRRLGAGDTLDARGGRRVSEPERDIRAGRPPDDFVSVGVAATIRAGVREPVIICLLVAALFDELSGNPLHFLILVGTAVAL